MQQNSSHDMNVLCGDGRINIRVGAIITKNGKILMAYDDRAGHYYSVGGRIKFGETAEEAVVREVCEETGRQLTVDRLGFILENYFPMTDTNGKTMLVYELGYYFYMNVPDDFEPVSEVFCEGDISQKLEWVSPDTEKTLYPEFFRTEFENPVPYVRFFSKDERSF